MPLWHEQKNVPYFIRSQPRKKMKVYFDLMHLTLSPWIDLEKDKKNKGNVFFIEIHCNKGHFCIQ